MSVRRVRIVPNAGNDAPCVALNRLWLGDSGATRAEIDMAAKCGWTKARILQSILWLSVHILMACAYKVVQELKMDRFGRSLASILTPRGV